ncbi:SUMF1/EgtB/PvdO family nonheme iron enzyme [Aetokthonos hydrillicola Thurmond2011]|jgi:formylglycine-generating enzyme required for sulfatase activity|uniref:SUMF1/EgtB/PvdO family nonheme iron enzyme n=1 Tax=Aetokthonos hydrillicola Thurmond2011 TaxID=2712845 RepID=A0AAP5I2E8_9CYAN|nr:SUMF1/EgtB/PvdO family nonheme iron enzyme [Aetokthonos hydrillicola]MBO3458338.1 SUMF1/EgtB/PvdO family nonheme iron enzyme [Aetokthonos hydrillicola CCALA 1050]MBW4585902.1 SUMF1/EgtB/PvdO family nonheme iron enzyme [Aetokthonos hydrillicola CCALA 1050]MDR9893873.1 SUMF1/EgtB/PvdO family nonheme iron enzyme [Aetokthonos hydrillicola Thurmond2011]
MVFSKVAVKVPINPGVKESTGQDNSFSNQILILFSAPLLNEDLSPVETLSIQEEIDAIASVLNDLSHPIAVEIVVKVATSRTLQDVLSSRVKPLIIHFIGHGMRHEESTALVLEDDLGMARCFSEEELAIALSNHNQPPCQLALLNACHSEKLAEAFVKAEVYHVIAVNAEDTILDLAARCFSRRLYQALFNQDTVANSFLQSRSAVKLDDKLRKLFNSVTFQKGVNFDEAFKFRLLPQISHDQSLIIEPADSHQVIYPQWSNTNIRRNDPNFVGRKQEIHQVIKVLVESDKRCIALHGMGGIGKTALAYAIGQWLHERDRYKDGVWFISLRDTDSVGTLIVKVKQTLELSSFSLERELKNRRVFLILDDLDKLIEKEPSDLTELLNSLLEQSPHLRLLLTSRDSVVRDIVYCHQEEVCSMGASETKEIFRKYAPSQEQWGDNDDLFLDFRLLVKFLDGYPLPIRLAASYMAETQYTLKMLREELVSEPMEVLDSYSPEKRKERSLRITLELSFDKLSVEAQDIFPLLAFFPSGLSLDLAKAIWGRNGNKALMELFKFSMAEKSSTATDWRVTLPEPARSYAESKLQKGRGLDYLAPQVLEFYYDSFCDRVLKLFGNRDEKKAQQLLLQENSNLILFLVWGYEYENNSNKICYSAGITASLSPYWRWIEPNKDPRARLDQALAAAQRNQDGEGEDLVRNVIDAFSAKEEFKDVQSLGLQSDLLNSFEFETVTVNRRGEIIEREIKQAQCFNEDLGEGITLEMVAIPSGKFLMGSPEGEGYDSEKPQHEVTIQAFYMGKYQITQGQWRVVAALPKINRDLELEPSYFKGKNLPVEQVSWYEAVEFCDRLSRLTGKPYCLPSEAEWEYACRAGTTTPFHFGETITSDLANYNAGYTYADVPKGEYRNKTIPVGKLGLANAFGLFDMHGNVWEWCADPWHGNYEGAPIDGNPWLIDNNSQYRLLRGGSWDLIPRFCRSAYRFGFARVDWNYFGVGFRVVVVGAARTY